MALLFEFAHEYQMERLRRRCVEFLSEDITKTPDGDSHLCDLLIIASEHSLTDRLDELIPRVARLTTAAIEPIHGKVDEWVQTEIYRRNARMSESILTSLFRPDNSCSQNIRNISIAVLALAATVCVVKACI